MPAAVKAQSLNHWTTREVPEGRRSFSLSLFFILDLFILFLAALGLRCDERGPLFVAVHGPLIAVASLVAEHRLQARGPQQLWHAGSAVLAHGLQSRRPSSCGARAQLLHGMWDPPDQGSNLCPVQWQADS